MALAVMFVVPHAFAKRTVTKEPVKSEFSAKVIKANVVTINQAKLVDFVKAQITVNHFELSEADRPPSSILAHAHYARFNRYDKRDALTKIKQHDWRLINYNYVVNRTVKKILVSHISLGLIT